MSSVETFGGRDVLVLDAGVAFHAPPQEVFGEVRTTYARDPDGDVVELQELATRHPFSVESARRDLAMASVDSVHQAVAGAARQS